MIEKALMISWLLLLFQEPVFVEETIDDKIEIGYGLAIGDVDGDRKPDILLADKKQFVWYRNGDWKRFVMVDNLTASDNVCIAARDIDGDGKVEVAVGAQWNPSETTDTARSGSVHILIRPKDPTQRWQPVKLHHEPTVHRMKWVKIAPDKFQLIVLPLHGKGNKDGQGTGVNVIAFDVPSRFEGKWNYRYIDQELHMTHNLDVVPGGAAETVYVAGREGVKMFTMKSGRWTSEWAIHNNSFGELRAGNIKGKTFLTGIEPMHGNVLSVYVDNVRSELTNELKQGHAIATADLMKSGSDQVVVGWREPDASGKTGIKLFVFDGDRWVDHWIDDNGIACEDLVVHDLDGDGRRDIIAAGRSSHNLKIYWNKN